MTRERHPTDKGKAEEPLPLMETLTAVGMAGGNHARTELQSLIHGGTQADTVSKGEEINNI